MIVCPVCQKEFKPSHNRGQVYCSYTCRGQAIKGDRHHRFKGGNISPLGYKRVMVDGVLMHEHRHVVELHLGRKLAPSEIIHHKDGNKLNNQLSNLELLSSNSEHMDRHRKWYSDTINKQCNTCEQIKPRTNFYRSTRKGRDSHHPMCKDCIKSKYPSSWTYAKRRNAHS